MKLKGQAHVDLNNISISNLDYELNLTHSDLGITTKKKDGTNENGICLESNLGPIVVKFDLLTDKNRIPSNLKDLNMYLTANYKLEDNISIGLKYETDGEQNKFEILSGTINSKLKNDNISLNLYTENIIYGYKNSNNTKISLFGNKINPSIGLLDDKMYLGYIHNSIEEIDEYGNKDNKCNNKLSLDLDINI